MSNFSRGFKTTFLQCLEEQNISSKASGCCNSDSIELTIYTALASLPCFCACHHERYRESEGFVLLPLSLGCLEMPFLKDCSFTDAVPVRDQILGSNLTDGGLFGAWVSCGTECKVARRSIDHEVMVPSTSTMSHFPKRGGFIARIEAQGRTWKRTSKIQAMKNAFYS